MRTRRLGFMALMAVGLVVGWAGLASATGFSRPSKAQVCEASKLEAAGEKAKCLLEEEADEVLGKTPNFAKCSEKFTKAFTKAESKAGPGVCPSEGDVAAIEAQVDTCVADIAAALSGTPPPPTCQQFPATGQTTTNSFRAGDDGAIQAGATLSYTDNADGTITDNNTRLMWEKKSDDGSIHDRDTTYTWFDAFTNFIAVLNTAPCFAGHCDWRLPNVKELQSIVNYGTFNPAVSPEFNTGCVVNCSVTTCSCTAAANYWSSSTVSGFSDLWSVDFFFGTLGFGPSFRVHGVRAVRGGL